MLRCAILIACFLTSMVSYAQDLYEIERNKEYEIIAVSAAMGGASYLLDLTLPELTTSDLNSLSVADINAFDRSATLHYSESADLLSDVFISVNSFAPLSLLLLKDVQSKKGEFLIMYGETFILNAGITFLVKSITQRPRPYTYNPNIPLENKLEAKSKRAFFSGHVSQSAAMSFFGAKVFSDLYPDSNYKPLVWTAAAVLPMVTAYGRYKAGQHYPSDVIAGYLVGGAIGVLVPVLHYSDSNINSRLALNVSGTGIGMTISLN